MKKFKLVIMVMGLLTLVACGNTTKKDSGNATTKSKVAELTIKNGYYVEPIGGDNESGQEYLALDLKVKNTSKNKMFIFDESFYLVEKGEDDKIKPVQLDYENKIKSFSLAGDLSSEKSVSGTVVFAIDEDKKYDLMFSSSGYDDEGNSHDDVELALDLTKYEKSKKELNEPIKALQAYIDVIFLQKENDDYEKLVANNSKTEIQMVSKEYDNMMKDTFYSYRLTDDDLAKSFESYIGNQKEAVEVELTSAGNIGDVAKVKVDFKGISSQAVNDLITNLKNEYDEKNNDYDSEKREQYAVSKLEEVYSTAEVGEPRNDIFVTMTKKDGKWTIDYKKDDSYENKYLLRAFLGEVD